MGISGRPHNFLILTVFFLAFAGCLSTGGNGGDSSASMVTPETHKAFPITASSKHGSTTCNDCHGKFDTFSQFSCIDCHTHAQAETTSKHSGISGYIYDSTACYSCHPDGTTAGSYDHETFFPIAAATKHAGIACASCHLDPNNRLVLGCATEVCHSKATTDTQHSSVSGYTYDSTPCYGCHPQGTADLASTVNHQTTFTIGSGTKHEKTTTTLPGPSGVSGTLISCSDCHIDPTNRPAINCTNCHTQTSSATAHSKVKASATPNYPGGYVWNTADCIDCHAYTNPSHTTIPSVYLVSDHTKCVAVLPAGNTVTVGITHQGGGQCRNCHTIKLASTPFTPPQSATDFGVYSCSNHHHSARQNCTCDTMSLGNCNQ